MDTFCPSSFGSVSHDYTTRGGSMEWGRGLQGTDGLCSAYGRVSAEVESAFDTWKRTELMARKRGRQRLRGTTGRMEGFT